MTPATSTAGQGVTPRPCEASPSTRQPFLHDRLTVVRAPSLVISGHDGQIAGGADGFFHADRRALSRLTVEVVGVEAAGVEVEALQSRLVAASVATFVSVIRGVGEHGADPAVTLARRREVTPGRLVEQLCVTNSGNQTVAITLEVRAGTDLASMEDVKAGRRPDEVAALAVAGGLEWTGAALTTRMTVVPDPRSVDAGEGTVYVEVLLGAGESWSAEIEVGALLSEPLLFEAVDEPDVPWSTPHVLRGDPRLVGLLERSLGDLAALLLADLRSSSPRPADRPSGQGDRFVAAGSPWFLTLFGRDSLWTARMLLPLGTRLAGETLRILARRQGDKTDAETGEEPGKILHELRRPSPDDPPATLPPCYYGTVDATPLWVVLLHDAWRWGLPRQEVDDLLDGAEAALGWIVDSAERDGTGFLRYHDRTGRGLSNQGWRDSADSIRWADGRLAEPPIALAEVQAYAYEALRGGAELMGAFGRRGAQRWSDAADALEIRFAEQFWIDGADGPLPATALDGTGARVDSVTSSLGHLLATGLLDEDRAGVVARRLARGDLDSGLGLRTLSSQSVGFNPLGYHTGSIWPHDTLIAARGLQIHGHDAAAWSFIDGILASAADFDDRLPELFAGTARAARAVPYPAACRPQAWAAASAVLALTAMLGLDADVPNGRLSVKPLAHPGVALSVRGLSVGGGDLSVHVADDGTTTVDAPPGLRVEITEPLPWAR